MNPNNPRPLAGFFVYRHLGLAKCNITIMKKFIPLLLLPIIATSQVAILEAFSNLNFTEPVDLQHPPDGSDRIFVLEQRGTIYVFQNDPSVTEKTMFLDIRDKVIHDGER